MTPIDSRVIIDIPQEVSSERPRYDIWDGITSLPTSQKGLLIALGVQTVFTAFVVALDCFIPDPPPDSLMPSWFKDGPVVAKYTQKWSFVTSSLITLVAMGACARHFLQKNQQKIKEGITPEIAALIKKCVEEEMQKATPGTSGLST